MTPSRLLGFAKRLRERAREVGYREALRQAGLRFLLKAEDTLPLGRVNKAGLFATDPGAIRAQEIASIRGTSLLFDASQVESTYPLIFECDGRIVRHAFLPASGVSRGLVVLFHGHNAFLHLGPMRPWREFDVLAPWDTFGWKRQGSWFWGEKGNGFVADILAKLIGQYRDKIPGRPWFCTGSSMGGFGALYHGIVQGADGVYVMCPQVDLGAKIRDYGADGLDNPYGHLQGKDAGPPDLLAVAEASDTLPPMFLIQNQFDHVNMFAEHAYRLLDVYNRKGAWYGLRVHPSIGHGGDGKQEEAELFFAMLLDRKPPRRVDFSALKPHQGSVA